MGMRRKVSLKNVFRRFLIFLLLGLCMAVLIPFWLTVLAANRGLITLANSNEQKIEALAPMLAATPEISDVQLPAGTKFLCVNKNYEYIDTNMSEPEAAEALHFAKTGQKDIGGEAQYLFVAREDEYIVLQYVIGSRYLSEAMNRYLPPPETVMIVAIAVGCLAVCIYLTAWFAGNLRRELKPILEATGEIEKQNLDFAMGHSKIAEFENVLESFDNMRNSLKESLEKQWRNEKAQREQIAALAHDLKTPLTVVQGNLDLLGETELDEEQRNYLEHTLSGSERMRQYIKLLIDISQAATGYHVMKEHIAFAPFMKQIAIQAETMCREKHLKLRWEQGNYSTQLLCDSLLLERAFMNLIANAIEHAPADTEVIVKSEEKSGYMWISVSDCGKGFSEEALKHACEKFYMEDRSRSSKLHYGMGLYIADTIIQQHDGVLILGNSLETRGAEVVVKIPV